jgi:hypothetical protein
MNNKTVLLTNLISLPYLIILIQLIFPNNLLLAQWVKTNGMDKTHIYSLISVGSNLIAGSYGECVYISANAGVSWNQYCNGLTSTTAFSLTSNGNNIYAGTGAGIFVSSDNGISWSSLGLVGLKDYYIWSMAFKGSTMFAGGFSFTHNSGYCFRSTNNGLLWTYLTNDLPGGVDVNCFAFDDTNIFIGTGANGIYVSTNNGTNWVQRNNGLTNGDITSVVIKGQNLFAGGAGGAYISTNKGLNWNQIDNGMNCFTVHSILVSGNNLFEGTDCGVFLSSNDGNTWKAINDSLTNTHIWALAIIGTDIFAATDGAGVWRRPLSELVGISKEINEWPTEYTLSQNYPNPFNPSTVISYSLPSAANTKLIIYNTLGQTLKVLENEFKNPGNYSVNFDASSLPSGIYFYKLEAGRFTQVKKMIFIR